MDGRQKNRGGLAWFARRASSWLLDRIKERKSVRGQANGETCKASGKWKSREPNDVGLSSTSRQAIYKVDMADRRRGDEKRQSDFRLLLVLSSWALHFLVQCGQQFVPQWPQ